MPVVRLGDVSLHYQERGSGPTVLGLMGFGLDQRYWAAQIPAVTARHRFLTFDNRGTGRSTGPPPTSISDLAADAIDLLDRLGVSRVALLGVSMGGAVAQRIAIDHPQRISALVLVTSWARPIEFMRRQAEVVKRLLEGSDATFLAEASLTWMFTPGFFETHLDLIDLITSSFHSSSGPPPISKEVLLAQLSCLLAHDALGELRSISCPALVVGAKLDMIVPAFASQEIAGAIPGSRLVMIEAGHGLMLERLEEFNRLLEDFLAETW